MLKADLTMAEVEPPPTLRCHSGHYVKEETTFQGKPVRWFSVSNKNKKIAGTYCEMCLVIANARKDEMRKLNGN